MPDELIEWLREMANLSDEDLAARFDDAAHQRLDLLVSACLVGQSVPSALSPDEFVAWIRSIRSSERDWSRSLGSVLIKAEDAHSRGDRIEAINLLKEFAEQCSWIQLKDVAVSEAQRHAEP